MNTTTNQKQRIAASIGNLLEWYDFALYGYFSEEIGKVFFPRFGEGSLLASFVVFAVGFLSRPLGAILFGYFGDRYGRRITLLVVFPLMFFSTAIIGLLPTYEQIGVWAQVLLVLVRVIQGMSVGSQYTTSITYLSEIDSKQQGRSMNLASPWVFANLGFILAAFITYIYLDQLIMHVSSNWQWRLPFLTSLLGVPFLIWQKGYLAETPDFKRLLKNNKVIAHNNPLKCIQLFPGSFFATIGVTGVLFVSYYVLFVFLVSNNAVFQGLPRNLLLINNIIALSVQVIFILLFAKLADRIGHIKVFVISAFILLIITYPAFFGFSLNNTLLSGVILSILAAVSAGFCVPAGIMIVDAYPTQYRLSGTAIGYNVSVALFGGTAPMVASLITSYSHSIIAPGLYIMFWCVIAILSVVKIKDLRKVKLIED